MKTLNRCLMSLLALTCALALLPLPRSAWAVATDQALLAEDVETILPVEETGEPADEAAAMSDTVAAPEDLAATEIDTDAPDQELSAMQMEAEAHAQGMATDKDSMQALEDADLTGQPTGEAPVALLQEVPWSENASENVANIQRALLAARDAGTSEVQAEVHLQPGKTYVINGMLDIYSNTILNLNGATIKRASSDMRESMLNTSYAVGGSTSASGYTKASNITIVGGTWDANYSELGKVLHFEHAQGITVKDATFIHSRSDHVIIFDGVKNATVSGCTFRDDITTQRINTSCRYANEAIHIDATITRASEDSTSILEADGTVCNGITVDGCVFDGVCNAAGAHYHKGEGDLQQLNLTVTNNTIKKVESGSTVVTGYNVKGWTVKGNTVLAGSGAGHFARLNGSKDFTIANNTVDDIDVFVMDNGNSGAKLKSNGTLSGNVVTGIKSNAFRASGIASTYTLSNESYTTTRTSIPSTSADYAFVYVDTANVTMKGCTLTYENTNFSTGSGYIDTIKFVNGTFTIQDNKIYNAPFAGLYLEKAAAGSTISGNTIGYCGRVASGTNSFTLILNNCKGCSVTKNTLKDCKQGAIYLNNCSDSTVKNNTLTVPSGKTEVKQYKCSNNTVSNNGPQFSGATSMPVGATATYSISGGTLTSSDTGIVSVSGKKLTAKKTGSITLTLKYNGRTYKKTVKVISIHGKTYEMESSVDGDYVLDIQGNKDADGTQMIVYHRNGGKNQKYQFYLQDDKSYAIRSLKSQKWMTVETATNKYVVQSGWGKVKDVKTLKWKITVDASNRVTFVNVASGKCFDVQGGKTKDSAKIIVWTSNGGKNQKWVLREKK